MRHRVGMTDTMALMDGTEADIERVVTAAMRDGTELLKADWKETVVGAGLGRKLANTVKARTFPAAGASLDPASWVWSKAPKLMDVYDRGPLIVPTLQGGRYLAIPTDKVPRKGRRLMTPVEVEATFNQDLILRKNARGTVLAFVDVVAGRNGRSYRPATRRRLAAGRKPKLVLMFVLVKWVKVRPRISLQAIAGRAQARVDGLVSRHWQAMPDRTAPMKGL